MFRAAVAAACRPASTVTNPWARPRNSTPEGVTLRAPGGVSDYSPGILSGRYARISLPRKIDRNLASSAVAG